MYLKKVHACLNAIFILEKSCVLLKQDISPGRMEGGTDKTVNKEAPDLIVALLLLQSLWTITIVKYYYDNQLLNQGTMPCRDETPTWIQNMIANVSRHRNGWCIRVRELQSTKTRYFFPQLYKFSKFGKLYYTILTSFANASFFHLE
jgi:hypothetical protein